jgi:hypothetical protein
MQAYDGGIHILLILSSDFEPHTACHGINGKYVTHMGRMSAYKQFDSV